MILTTNGKIGINTLAPPSDTLVVANLGGYGITHTDGTVKVSTRLDDSSGHLGTQSNHPLGFFTNGSAPQMTLTTGGKLGIGTSSPSHMLTVQTDGLGIAQTNGTVTLTTGLDGTGAALGTKTNHDLRFFTNSVTKMTLATSGNLGIGTAEPSEKLHVAGNLRIDRDFMKPGGPFVFWPNTDKVPNADLLRFMDKDGNTALQLKPDGRLWLKEKPFVCKSVYVPIDKDSVDTGYSYGDWVAVIAGFVCESEDDDDDREVNHYCYAAEAYGNWHVFARRKYVRSHWRVHLVFIRRELVGGAYSYS
jgi:hypothetical protein